MPPDATVNGKGPILSLFQSEASPGLAPQRGRGSFSKPETEAQAKVRLSQVSSAP